MLKQQDYTLTKVRKSTTPLKASCSASQLFECQFSFPWEI